MAHSRVWLLGESQEIFHPWGVQIFSLKDGEKKGTVKKLEIDPMSHGNWPRVQERAGGDHATQKVP